MIDALAVIAARYPRVTLATVDAIRRVTEASGDALTEADRAALAELLVLASAVVGARDTEPPEAP